VVVDDLKDWPQRSQGNSYYPDADTAPHVHATAVRNGNGYIISMVAVTHLGRMQNIAFGFDQRTKKFVSTGPGAPFPLTQGRIGAQRDHLKLRPLLLEAATRRSQVNERSPFTRRPDREKVRHGENGGHSGAPSSVCLLSDGSSRWLRHETLGSVSGVLQFVTNDEVGPAKDRPQHEQLT
jgi:hypothetical protein